MIVQKNKVVYRRSMLRLYSTITSKRTISIMVKLFSEHSLHTFGYNFIFNQQSESNLFPRTNVGANLVFALAQKPKSNL